MANIAVILFSVIALLCGILTSFWLLKLREELLAEKHLAYTLSALVAISFLLGFPLWTMFNEFFQFTSEAVTRISYLLFSIGYFGVLLITYLAVSEVSNMKEFIEGVKSLHVKNKKMVEKLRELERENNELEKFKKVMVNRELKMVELKNEIERLKGER